MIHLNNGAYTTYLTRLKLLMPLYDLNITHIISLPFPINDNQWVSAKVIYS